jgi:4-oxalocrotonate tautomerase
MPIIDVQLFEGRTLEEKRSLVQAITTAVVETLNTKPEKVRITLVEMDKRNHSVGGILAIDWPEEK